MTDEPNTGSDVGRADGPGVYDPDWITLAGGISGDLLKLPLPRTAPVDAELTRLLDPAASSLLQLATMWAARLGHTDTGTDHLLWAACRSAPGRSALRRIKLDPDALAHREEPGPSFDPEALRRPPLTPGLKRVLMVAGRVASQSAATMTGTNHLMAALAAEPNTRAARILAARGIDRGPPAGPDRSVG